MKDLIAPSANVENKWLLQDAATAKRNSQPEGMRFTNRPFARDFKQQTKAVSLRSISKPVNSNSPTPNSRRAINYGRAFRTPRFGWCPLGRAMSIALAAVNQGRRHDQGRCRCGRRPD